MITNFYTLVHIAAELNHEFSGQIRAEVFTQNRGELVISFAQTAAVITVGCDPSNNFIFARKTFARARRNSVNIFTDAADGTVERIFMHSSDRQMHIHFTDSREIVVQLFGSKANVLLLDTNGTIVETFLKKSNAIITPADLSSIAQSNETVEKIISKHGDQRMIMVLKHVFPQFGSVLIKELLTRAGLDGDKMAESFSGKDIAQILDTARKLKDDLLSSSSSRIYFNGVSPVRFSIIPLHHLNDFTYQNFDSVSDAIQTYQARLYREKTILTDKERIIDVLQKEQKHIENTLDKIAEKAEIMERAEQYEKFGKLLITQLHLLKKGDASAVLENFIDGSNELIEIPLDVHLAPSKNAERYFEKADKSRRAKEEQKKHLSELTEKGKKISRLLESAEEITTFDDMKIFVEENKIELSEFGLKAKKSGQLNKEEIPPFRVFTVEGGFQVWAGKSGENNDLLSTRHTAKNDLWFHARGVGGSHVVLKIGTGKGEVSKQAIEQAASIAAYYSKMKNSKMVPVAMCEGKYVRKPKGVPAGTVTLEREKTIFVEPRLPHHE